MSLKELADEIAKETGMTRTESLRLLKIFINVIVKQILKGQLVKLQNLCTFYIDIAQEKSYFNPMNGATEIKGKRFVLRTKYSPLLKKKIDAKKTY
jgi:nucleoid DNA-binding protein